MNALFHVPENEEICGKCFQEFKDQLATEGEDPDVLFKFVKKVYGRRDGPQGFCDFVNGVMSQKNLIRCEAHPCFFSHERLHILVELHQDDFHCTAPAESLMWLKDELKDEIRLKFSDLVYPGMRHSHLKASRLVTSQGTLIVASAPYITDILDTMRMLQCSGAPTPITTRRGNPEADGKLLEPEEH